MCMVPSDSSVLFFSIYAAVSWMYFDFLSLYSGHIIHSVDAHEIQLCVLSQRQTLKSISDSAIVPFRRIHSRELKCEMCDANFTVSMIVSIPGYFSECKHIIVLFIILVLKNSAPPTRAYYLSWQSTEELAQTSVQTLTTN